MNKKIFKKWWFGVIIVLVIGFIFGPKENIKGENYILSYTWNLKDTKIDTTIPFDDGTVEEYKYVVLGIENNQKDLKSGKYEISTNENPKATFMIYITNEYYEKPSEIPDTYEFDMVQGFDSSKITVQLEKGQFLYLCQNYNGQGNISVKKI